MPRFDIPRLLTLFAGALLGAGLGGVALIALAWATLDPCSPDAPLPSLYIAVVLAFMASVFASLAQLFDARPRVPFLMAMGVLLLDAALAAGLVAQNTRLERNCTWILYPAVPE